LSKYVRLYCSDFEKWGWRCCSSCHDDWHEGYGDCSDMEEEFKGDDLPAGLPEEVVLVQVFKCCGGGENGEILEDRSKVAEAALTAIKNGRARELDGSESLVNPSREPL